MLFAPCRLPAVHRTELPWVPTAPATHCSRPHFPAFPLPLPAPQVPARRSVQQTLDPTAVCAAIAADADLSTMANSLRPACSLLQSAEAQQMLAQMAAGFGMSPEDVNVVLGCICNGSRRRALGAADVPLTPELIGQLVAQYPELQSMVDAVRPFCGLLSTVDVVGMLSAQGFSPSDAQALLTYICG